MKVVFALPNVRFVMANATFVRTNAAFVQAKIAPAMCETAGKQPFFQETGILHQNHKPTQPNTIAKPLTRTSQPSNDLRANESK